MSLAKTTFVWFAQRGFLTFKGRRSRLSFFVASLWLSALPLLGSLVFLLINFATEELVSGRLFVAMNQILGFLLGCLCIAVVVMHVFIGIQRLQDANQSGWWYLLMLIPIAQCLLTLYLLFVKGSPEANRFGENPLTHPRLPGSVYAWTLPESVVATNTPSPETRAP